MNLTNGEIFDAREPLQKLLGERFPIKVAYDLAVMTHKLNDQFEVINDVRNGLIKRFGKEKDGPIRIGPGDENFPKYVEEVEELMSQEVELVIEKVRLPEGVDGKAIQVEPSVLMSLLKFVEVG